MSKRTKGYKEYLELMAERDEMLDKAKKIRDKKKKRVEEDKKRKYKPKKRESSLTKYAKEVAHELKSGVSHYSDMAEKAKKTVLRKLAGKEKKE
jgi:hypothetical protein